MWGTASARGVICRSAWCFALSGLVPNSEIYVCASVYLNIFQPGLVIYIYEESS